MINSVTKARLKWHCRRGMLELDIILLGFAEKHLDNLTEAQLATFERFLNNTDPELFSWLMGHEEPQEKEFVDFVDYIKFKGRTG